MIKSLIITIILTTSICISIFSQEKLIGLQNNPELIKLKSKQLKKLDTLNSKVNYVKIPFIDDFSYNNIYPDQNKWADQFVYINNCIPINPFSVGVATFDALNEKGELYPDSILSSSLPIADYLTSLPFKLDSLYDINDSAIKILTPQDSLFLSFLYQPQGLGNAPESHDSLVLEFYSPIDSTWKWIWSTPGMDYNTFKALYNTDFKLIMIQIKDNMFFQKGFRFRFKNYVSLAGTSEPTWNSNVDFWNLDYVYLSNNRSLRDTIYKDVAFTERPQSLLKNYIAMPWKHYLQDTNGLMNSFTFAPFKNNTNQDHAINNGFYIIEELSSNPHPYTNNGGAIILSPFMTNSTYPVPFKYTFNSEATDKALFKITDIIDVFSPDIIKSNDTVSFTQNFSNYYAYDNGVPMAGYGIENAEGSVAYKFTTTMDDTLKAVQMYFNYIKGDDNKITDFTLKVWSSLSPEIVIYQKVITKPKIEDSLYMYHQFILDKPLFIPKGIFYVGFKQNSANMLNIGFDLRNNSSDKIFYNSVGQWENTKFSGSLMIRPVFGKVTSIGINSSETSIQAFKIFPNPANDYIRIQNMSEKTFDISIYDICDKEIIRQKVNSSDKLIDLKRLVNGLYIIRITESGSKNTFTSKIIINH
ncbi:MAG: T9SS type A sorting domain-containing protein [Bacteroidota bacterium]|nr:T9SS type A sorting domain-containing protein [Bacteroidota bacterium]